MPRHRLLLAWFLQVAGCLLIPLFVAAIVYLHALGCGMNASGCHSSAETLFWRFALSWQAWWFWAVLLVLVGMVWLGHRLRTKRVA